MAGIQPANDKLLVALDGDKALVKVFGRGTFKISSPLREFGIAAISKGCTRIIFEMSGCSGMDSTFMGTIAGLALRLREKDSTGEVLLCGLSEKTMGLLKTLGLNQIAKAYAAGAAPAGITELFQGVGDYRRLDQPDESDERAARTMLDAHEALVDVEPANIEKFRDVISFLREDVDRNTQG
jgi:anti-sigma B factor antagonist